MTEDAATDSESDRPKGYVAAALLWHDEAKRRWIGEKYGITTGNFALFTAGLKQKSIPIHRWDDDDFWEEYLEDLDDQMRGGTKKDRDEWFEWDGDRFRAFRNWVHREKKPKLSPSDQKKPFTRPQIEKWWEEWCQLSPGKQALYELEEPLDE